MFSLDEAFLIIAAIWEAVVFLFCFDHFFGNSFLLILLHLPSLNFVSANNKNLV